MTEQAAVTVHRNESNHHYEAELDGKVVGLSGTEPGRGRWSCIHTETVPEYEGQRHRWGFGPGRARRHPGSWREGRGALPVHQVVRREAPRVPGLWSFQTTDRSGPRARGGFVGGAGAGWGPWGSRTAGAVLSRFGPATRAWFEAAFAEPTAGPGGRVGGDQRGPQRAGGRADRLRQDPGRVPVGAGPARRRARCRSRRSGAGCST